uniref:WW domain-containing protein n=2 Tax=Aplanochytrium stocchinoi TaxID=215587 RepID=A0A7S3V0D2_9STRA
MSTQPIGTRDFSEAAPSSVSTFVAFGSETSLITGLDKSKRFLGSHEVIKDGVTTKMDAVLAPKAISRQSSMRMRNKKSPLRCPQCQMDGFANMRELGKHAMKCRKAGSQTNKLRSSAAPLAHDRLGRMLQLKKMQKEQEKWMQEKEEQEKIEQEMDILRKMEKAQEKRDQILKKQQQEEAVRKAEEKRKCEIERKKIEEEERRKQLIEEEMQKRAEALMQGSDTDSDSDSDAESKQRRVRLQEAIERKQRLKKEEEEKEKKEALANIMAVKKLREAVRVVTNFKKTGNNNVMSEEETTTPIKDLHDDILFCPYEGYTAAHIAAYNNSTEILEKIIKCGVDLRCQDPEGRTPLHLCALYGNVECLELLVKAQLKQSDPNDEIHFTRLVDYSNRTPIYCACFVGDFTAVAYLIDIDPEAVEICDLNGNSAIHIAASYDYIDCLNLLLQYDMNPNSFSNYSGLAPIHLATKLETIETLVEYGADYFAFDYQNRSLLFYACANNFVEIVEYLISLDEENVCLEYPDVRGRTSLHAAAGKGHLEIMKILVAKGVDPNPRDEDSITPIFLAHHFEYDKCVQMLESSGAVLEPGSGQQELLSDCAQLFVDSLNLTNETWSECYDEESGYYYYWSNNTGEVTWEKPASGIIISIQ